MAQQVKTEEIQNVGTLTQYTHESTSVKTPMVFSIFIPAQNKPETPSNVLFWLSGLTCTDQNFCLKAGQPAFAAASETNTVLVICDTSPRGTGCPVPDAACTWDFGEGAGFYLNATTPDFKTHFNMYNYVTDELYTTVQSVLGNLITSQRSIAGHSMGGLGALNLYLKSGLYTSCSAFAPISNPVNCPWGKKAFTHYLGPVESSLEQWEAYDPSINVKKAAEAKRIDVETPIKIEQGLEDKFYKELQLLPEAFLAAARDAGVAVDYSAHEGLDHSIDGFVAKFVADHVKFHAAQMTKKAAQ